MAAAFALNQHPGLVVGVSEGRAVYNGRRECSEQLVRQGASLTATTTDGNTALHLAAFMNQLSSSLRSETTGCARCRTKVRGAVWERLCRPSLRHHAPYAPHSLTALSSLTYCPPILIPMGLPGRHPPPASGQASGAAGAAGGPRAGSGPDAYLPDVSAQMQNMQLAEVLRSRASRGEQFPDSPTGEASMRVMRNRQAGRPPSSSPSAARTLSRGPTAQTDRGSSAVGRSPARLPPRGSGGVAAGGARGTPGKAQANGQDAEMPRAAATAAVESLTGNGGERGTAVSVAHAEDGAGGRLPGLDWQAGHRALADEWQQQVKDENRRTAVAAGSGGRLVIGASGQGTRGESAPLRPQSANKKFLQKYDLHKFNLFAP
ncbi:ANK_REP_REGION domain-containing protein [Haematococcus lacustris]|uniref:ANK_REP_REGION domain-containing protein n=1 Tax=Haematococcus lacustris TaxID=44745 RepID=A0A699ZGR4_HAELA|nr:ANK_REP_REGION domain-containing protein [Haematococcus lacustris]